MLYTGLIKRILPFALTFAGGLLIASFFVTIGTPNFGSRHRENRRNEVRELRIETDQLRREKCNLRREIEELKMDSSNWDRLVEVQGDLELPVPPPPPVAPRRNR